MICPKCRREFAWHVTVCPDCDTELVERLPAPEPTPDAELVPVLRTGDAGLVPLAKSMLEAEGIEYLVRGEGLQDLFGAGRVGGYNFVVGPAEFLVRAEDGERAKALLEGLTADPPDAVPDAGDGA